MRLDCIYKIYDWRSPLKADKKSQEKIKYVIFLSIPSMHMCQVGEYRLRMTTAHLKIIGKHHIKKKESFCGKQRGAYKTKMFT